MTDIITEKMADATDSAPDITVENQTQSQENPTVGTYVNDPTDEANDTYSKDPTDEIRDTSDKDTAAKEKDSATDYAKIIEEDLATLKAQFPELSDIEQITDLNNPLRYAALRDLGLTAEEAYLATAKRVARDTRAHLRSARGRNAGSSTGMSYSELATVRELFPGKNDAELERLYKRVSK